MRIILPLLALIAAPAAAQSVAPILTGPEAHDALSYAQPEKARVTHVDLDLTTDFARQRLSGTATLDILAQPGVSEIVLDDDGLVITGVADSTGRVLRWSVGKAEPDKGAPLTIWMGPSRRIVIHYSS